MYEKGKEKPNLTNFDKYFLFLILRVPGLDLIIMSMFKSEHVA